MPAHKVTPKNRYPALPAPHQGVHVYLYSRFDLGLCEHFIVTYTGSRDALIAAAVAEPAMFNDCSGLDIHGFAYRRQTPRTARRHQVVRYIRSSRVLDSLPGIPEGTVPQAIRWLNDNPLQLHTERVDGYEIITGKRDALIEAAHVTVADFERCHGWCDIKHDYLVKARLSETIDGYHVVRGTITQSQLDEELIASAPVNVREAIAHHRAALYEAAIFHQEEIEKLMAKERERRSRPKRALSLVVSNVGVAT